MNHRKKIIKCPDGPVEEKSSEPLVIQRGANWFFRAFTILFRVLIRFIPTIRTAYVVNKRTGNYNLGLLLKEDTPLREGTFQAEELSKQIAGNVNAGRQPATLKFFDRFGVIGVGNRVFMLQQKTKGKQLSTYPL